MSWVTTTILLSEFQPIHSLHKNFIKEFSEKTSDDLGEILFCIDGSWRKLHADSPLSTKEREETIHILMQEFSCKYSITHLHDTDNDDDRFATIQHLFTEPSGKKNISHITTDDKKTYNLISQKIWEDTAPNHNHIWYSLLPDKSHLQSTIRNQFAAQNFSEAQKKLPDSIYDYLMKIWLWKRMKNYKSQAFWWPNVATDILIRNTQWQIAIIKRRDEPFWYALPWGMIDRWEYAPQAAAREALEETHASWTINTTLQQQKIINDILTLWESHNISVSPEQQPFYVQTSPTRDIRGHIMTLAYIMDYNGNLEKGDDADNVERIYPHDALAHPLIPQQHKEIIIAYLAQQ